MFHKIVWKDFVQLIWDDFLKLIKEESGSRVVETWFKAVSLQKWEEDTKTVYLKTPNQFVTKWLQQHYTTLIKTHLSRLLHIKDLNLVFLCNSKKESLTRDIIPASIISSQNNLYNSSSINTSIVKFKEKFPKSKKNKKKETSQINKNYTFNSFVVGPSNSLAHAAAYAVCQNLGKVYNPLFIYGGTGLGKTHLLHAIGNEVFKKKNQITIRYQTTDKFTTEFINSIRLDKTHHFREKYQNTDLLMLDDIQFLSNKEQTQEAFFHIFNTLHEKGAQIILSSDTFPKEIKGFQSRLKSRLEWGLVADMQMPDLETKIAILKKKAETNKINLKDEVANFIASKIKSNIRELEGALIRVEAFGTLTNQQITLQLAKKVLLNIREPKKDGIMLNDILKNIAKIYSISVNDLKSKKRQKDIVFVRQVTFYIMKKLSFCSLQVIGEFVGKRDHSTVLHSITKIEKKLQTDAALAQKLNQIEQEILMN
ncbi:chromosomal replication initiator protein DnaA [Candidatus Dependentiae bacterium]|nr:chromosomal replication initiator protein DnaA [Candidatus Dependentiae bacterium]